MKKTIFLLSYALIACLIFIVASNRENKELQYLLHGQYTNKMADASTQLNELQQAVQQSLMYKDTTALHQSLQDVWRLSSDIKYSIADLPLDQEFTSEWMNYLGRLGNNAKMTMTSKENADKWHANIKNVSENLTNFSNDWQVATAHVLQQDNNYKHWLEEQTADQSTGNFKNMAKSIKTYRESDFPLTASESDHEKRKNLQKLDDRKISESEAINRFKDMFPELSNATIAVKNSRKGAPYPFYHITFTKGERTGYADLTVKGGHLLSYLVERPFGQTSLPILKLKKLADQHLKELGYTDVVETDARENSEVWHLSYARVDQSTKAKIYADGVQVKIAKDTGEVVGLNGIEYIQKEKVKPQTMKKIDWNTFFNRDAEVMEEDLAYVEDKDFVERLCYEVTVRVNANKTQHTYKVLIDTETGEVIKNERLS
ncbi:PepSY1/2 domain-containing protein [Rummeliibacillus stabekisii]|uniref:PepSY1/2 domain-containing protein n=1 Tax=Rummeliibacillus stabekisii TaxID=241244 RepID=UPI001174A1FE|nr:PepSY1/2 domain-containing protein [Rummeliibacillus stabekisii]MBB5169736.1 spore germination protein [Rummeliibacillus stabekisii]GEL03994.1 germination protein YpeB [Rummeliibacillus stabekisii]